ncbi:hypothetical protein Tco_1321008 [Tanacetum coccineum]
MALALLRLKLDVLKESLTIGVPLIEDTGFTIETVTIEYEWKPPRCDLCKIFGHVHDHCPKNVSIPITVVNPNVPTHAVEMTNEGFQTVGKKKKKGKSKSTNGRQIGGKITMSNSYADLEDESDEDVENVYDESANLFHSKTGESLSTFTAVAG